MGFGVIRDECDEAKMAAAFQAACLAPARPPGDHRMQEHDLHGAAHGVAETKGELRLTFPQLCEYRVNESANGRRLVMQPLAAQIGVQRRWNDLDPARVHQVAERLGEEMEESLGGGLHGHLGQWPERQPGLHVHDGGQRR